MKALLTALIIGLLSPLPVMAANPLTKAEQTVCRSLNHCLRIVDAHPHDSFDYGVLATEFRRFGRKGRDALLRRIKTNDEAAANAADLLALSRDPSALSRLKALAKHSGDPSNGLAARTLQALTARLEAAADQTDTSFDKDRNAATEDTCLRDFPADFAARKNEMPFFEANIATPDKHGAFRPSAVYRFDPSPASRPERFMSRGWLRAAVPVPGGWFAAYPNGLVYYDSKTGKPDIRHRSCFVSLQRQDMSNLAPNIWAFLDRPNGGTRILDVGADSQMKAFDLSGRLSHLERHIDGSLCAIASDATSVTLRTDGSAVPGCLKDHNP